MKLWLYVMPLLAFALAGCTSPGGSIESPHGYVLDMDVGAFGFKVEGTPTILQESESPLHSEYDADGSAKDMPATYVVRPDGTIKATGLAAYWLARAAYCRAADCSNEPPPPN